MQYSNHQELLTSFLSVPLSGTDAVFSLFEALPNAIPGSGNTSLERFVYISGTRPDRLLLVAHADTVWDTGYNRPKVASNVIFENGVFRSGNPACGIGADDRAGCAMLYALRESGHSLLIVSGEEHGKLGARYLRKYHKSLFRQLNEHRFMLELDCPGTNTCLFSQVPCSDAFKQYIETNLGVRDTKKKGGCDLQILCRKVCGVNVGIGYHNVHSAKETLVLAEWENSLAAVTAFLDATHPRFPISKYRRFVMLAKKPPAFVLYKLKKLLKRV